MSSIVALFELLETLRNLQSSILEFRETAALLLKDLRDELKDELLKLLSSSNPQERFWALCGIPHVKNWKIAKKHTLIIERIARNDPDMNTRLHALLLLERLNCSEEKIIRLIRHNLTQINSFDVQHHLFLVNGFLNLAKRIDANCLLKSFILKRFGDDADCYETILEYLIHWKKWDREVRTFALNILKKENPIVSWLRENGCDEPFDEDYIEYGTSIMKLLKISGAPKEDVIMLKKAITDANVCQC